MSAPIEKTENSNHNSIRERIWRIIFLSESTPAKAFDVVLLFLIGSSILVIMLESVSSIQEKHGSLLFNIEWVFTILFTIEYFTRLCVVRKKRRYVLSFFGIVDLLSVLPTYIGLFITGGGHFIIIRILRMLRMFRILKMVNHMGETNVLLNALKASRPKIAVFVFGLLAIVCIEGTLMYVLEGSVEGSMFTSIPQSIYWGIVTVTTVGYGDITPVTVAGKMLASVMMVTGFAIIAVPTGIVSAELNRSMEEVKMDIRHCSGCGYDGHDPKAGFCKMCGRKL